MYVFIFIVIFIHSIKIIILDIGCYEFFNFIAFARTKSKFLMHYWCPDVEKWIKKSYNDCSLCKARLKALQETRQIRVTA